MGEIGGPQRMGPPHCVGDERGGLRFCNPPLCGTIGRVCRTDWRAAKDGAPTVSVRISFYMARPMYRFAVPDTVRSEEHTSELQSHSDLVCRLLLEKKKKKVVYLHHGTIHGHVLYPVRQMST